jgi:hypothetical protein
LCGFYVPSFLLHISTKIIVHFNNYYNQRGLVFINLCSELMNDDELAAAFVEDCLLFVGLNKLRIHSD